MFSPKSAAKAVAVAGAAAAATGALAPSALAAPENRHTLPVQVSCTDGSSYLLSTLDTDSPWGALHDVHGSGTFIPVYYRDVHVQVSTADGTVPFEEDSPDYTPRGAVPEQMGEVKDCSFEITDTEEDPNLGTVVTRIHIELGLLVTPAGRSH